MSRILLFLLLGVFGLNTHAAVIDLKVDRNPISVDESLQLIFSATETPDVEPDFSPLQNEFTILNRQQSSSFAWNNGQRSNQMQWILTVMAKKTGTLQIPAIAFGSDASSPLLITVTDSVNKSAASSDSDIFLDVEASPETPYVQSQIVYTLKIYRQRQVQWTEARLTELDIKDTLVTKLGEGSQYAKKINDVEYIVTERKYALFPQKSGKLVIPAVHLMAEMISTTRPSLGGFFGQTLTKTQRVSSRTIELEVLPIPQTFTGSHWLSAEHLELQEQWSAQQPLNIKIGEPVTRSIKLLAKGASVGQLPELFKAINADALSVYPDQPVLNEHAENDGVQASREEKMAFMANKPGSYQLPAIEISWFNTRNQRVEVARLPPVTLTAIADASQTSRDTQVMPPNPTENPVVQQPTSAILPAHQTAANEEAIWFWMACFSSGGWLLTLMLWFWRSRSRKAVAPTVIATNTVDNDTALVKPLKQACMTNDPQAAKTALLQWGKARFQASSLGAIAPFCEARLRDEILLLNRHLYAQNGADWQGKLLWQYFAENKARQQLDKQNVLPLEPLHKIPV